MEDGLSPVPAIPTAREVYSHGYDQYPETLRRRHASMERTAAIDASFLLPHIHAGQRLLDCGCGSGGMTLDFAALVAPGEVVGIDIGSEAINAARAAAVERGSQNVQFEVASVYDLPYPDTSFDIVFAHTVLEHLRDPLAACKEMRRVLRPGGIIGIRDTHWGAQVLEPLTPALAQGLRIVQQFIVHNGGSPFYASNQRRLLLDAGFVRTEGFASAVCRGAPETVQDFAKVMAGYCQRPAFRDIVLAQGWTDQQTLDQVVADAQAWGDRPDAYNAVMMCAALGWVGTDTP